MRAVSIQLGDDDYRRFEKLARLTGRPINELVREAMSTFLRKEDTEGRALTELAAHDSGRMLKGWTREELLDEMLER